MTKARAVAMVAFVGLCIAVIALFVPFERLTNQFGVTLFTTGAAIATLKNAHEEWESDQ